MYFDHYKIDPILITFLTFICWSEINLKNVLQLNDYKVVLELKSKNTNGKCVICLFIVLIEINVAKNVAHLPVHGHIL